jgi:hypothetical protein
MREQAQKRANSDPPLRRGPPRSPDPEIGTKFGKWEVIGPASDKIYHCPRQNVVHRRVMCRCECGTERKVVLFRLLQGGTKSCGACGVARKQRRGSLAPGEIAIREVGDQVGRSAIWRILEELPSRKGNRMVLCRCQRGHARSMLLTTFRGDPKKLPMCHRCLQALRAYEASVARTPPRRKMIDA